MAQKRSRHHRKPRSIGGTDDNRNLSWVSDRKHRAWHTLFTNMTVEQIVKELNRYWIDPDYEITFKKTNATSPCDGEMLRDTNQLKIKFP